MSHNNERNPWGIEIKKESHTGTIVLLMLGLAVVLGIIGVIVIFSSGMLEQSKRQLDNGDSYELWEKGTAVTGTAVKTGDQTSTLDRIAGRQKYAIDVYYTVDGEEYSWPGLVCDADVFDEADGEDQDGRAELEVHYNREDPSQAAVYGTYTVRGDVIGKDAN